MKKILLVFLCFCLFISLNACTQQNQAGANYSDLSHTEIESDTSIHSSADDDNSLSEAMEVSLPQNSTIDFIQRTLSSGLLVNADVELSSAVDLNALSVFRAEIEIQDFDKAKKLFVADKKILSEEVLEDNPDSYTNAPYHLIETTDGGTLSGAEELYFSYPFAYEDLSFFYDAYEMQEKNDEMFLTGQELSFKSIDDVKTELMDIVKELNIQVDNDPLVYTFEKGAQCSQDFYLFVFSVTIQGMPVSKHSNGSFGDGSMTGGTSVRVAYSENGVQIFEHPYKFRVTETLSENQTGKDAEEALSLLEDKYNSIILEGNYIVEKIKFEYVPVPENGGPVFSLVPAWRFYVKHEFAHKKEEGADTATFETKSYIVFNAITGEEIINDLGAI